MRGGGQRFAEMVMERGKMSANVEPSTSALSNARSERLSELDMT